MRADHRPDDLGADLLYLGNALTQHFRQLESIWDTYQVYAGEGTEHDA